MKPYRLPIIEWMEMPANGQDVIRTSVSLSPDPGYGDSDIWGADE